jgi:hypothetical protein
MVVTFEIRNVESQNIINRIDAHDGNEAGIENFDALDAVVPDKLFSRRVDRRGVRQ